MSNSTEKKYQFTLWMDVNHGIYVEGVGKAEQ